MTPSEINESITQSKDVVQNYQQATSKASITSRVERQQEQKERVMRLLNKRQRISNSPPMPPSPPLLGMAKFENQDDLALSIKQEINASPLEGSTFSTNLSIPFKLKQLSEERDKEYNKLLTQLKDNSFESIKESLKKSEKEKENIDRLLFQLKAEDFQEITSEQIQSLTQQLQRLQSSFTNTSNELYKMIGELRSSTENIFTYHHEVSTSTFKAIDIETQHLKQKVKDIDRAFNIVNETIDLLSELVATSSNNEDTTKLQKEFYKVIEELIAYIKEESLRKDIIIKHNQEKFNNQLNQQKEYFNQQLTATVLNDQFKIFQSNNTNEKLVQQVQNLTQDVQVLQQITRFTYFTCNLLVDQDHYLKQGIQQSSSKQAQMLDLMSMTNKILQEHVSSDVAKKQLEDNFKDSVMSLQLNKQLKIPFPQVEKVPEYFNIPPIDEREDANVREDNQFKKLYKENVDDFFSKYPRETYLFSIKDGNNDTITQAPNVPPIPSTSTNEVNNTPDLDFSTLLSKLKRSSINVEPSVPHQSTGLTLGSPTFKPNPIKPNILVSEAPKKYEPTNTLPAFDTSKLLHSYPRTTDPNPYGTVYPSAVDKAKLYATFNFREKYTRNIHPNMFLMQFETIADQCQLSDTQRVTQFMFCLQHECLDWYKYKVSASNYNISWQKLKVDFVKAFSQNDEEARDELYRMMQEYDETPQQYLNRLRRKTTLTNLTDSDIKKQFCAGLKVDKARIFISFLRQFDKENFDNLTTTTLLQRLEKQAQLEGFSLIKSRSTNFQANFKNILDRAKQFSNKVPPSNKYPIITKPYNSNNNNKNATTKAYPKEKFPYTKNTNTKKVNFADDVSTSFHPTGEQPTIQPQHDTKEQEQQQEQNSQSNDNDQPRYTQEEFIALLSDPSFQFEQLSQQNEQQEQQETQQQYHSSSVIFAGPSIPTDAIKQLNQLMPNQSHSMNAGEGEQVHSMFRKGQKNTNTYTDKLVELARQGKELNKLNIKDYRRFQYISMPELQLLTESPSQFIHLIHYISECLNNDDNLLKNINTTKLLKQFQQELAIRLAELQGQNQSNNSNSQTQAVNQINACNMSIPINPITHLCYISVTFQNTPVKALIDTGSTVTVISENFCHKNKIQIPTCFFSKQVKLADGTITFMKEWRDTRIQLDQYLSVTGTILISKNNSYDMLLGLDIYTSINGTISIDHLRYSITIDGRERFGKIPIIKQTIA